MDPCSLDTSRQQQPVLAQDRSHHLHVTHLGPAKFIGLGWFVENEDELKKFAKAPGASGIENIDDLIRHTYGSADFREGMDAFLGKRAPKWTGT